MATYFCHNTYVAQVVDITMKENKPVIDNRRNESILVSIMEGPISLRNIGLCANKKSS
ncbi:hypothetical protein [Segetibacter sp.]|uniref:hypothetical protein n=1 Tax=Segetibacter sp. TaxID=2231182 RepID=UPI00261D47A1|nr:hypothetical protein [Segetibacter sp.]